MDMFVHTYVMVCVRTCIHIYVRVCLQMLLDRYKYIKRWMVKQMGIVMPKCM